MAKGKKRSNREIRKPKQEKVEPKPADAVSNQTHLITKTNTKRAKGKPRSS